MRTPKVTDNKIVFGPCRLSYVHVFEKYSPKDGMGEPKYMVTILIPKSEKATIRAINEAIENCRRKGITSKWGGSAPKKLALPLQDGDEKEKDPDGAFADCYYINAKSDTRPGVIDRNRAPLIDEEDFYSGVWSDVSVTFFPYMVSGKCGIGCALNNLLKFKDDDRFGGKASAESDFEGYDDDDDDL